MPSSSRNPIGFTPLPVTVFTFAVYIALFAILLVTHHVLPSAPSNPTPSAWPGVNITQAWLDLEHLSQDYHPFISKSNQAVKQWLVSRIKEILDTNKADWESAANDGSSSQTAQAAVTLFDDSLSNITYAYSKLWITYFEAENIMVYIRGTEDEPGRWWERNSSYDGLGGVMVNAHYDSVSTGFGATDDGVGVVTVLQLISHFTRDGFQPKKGILALLNNGEEDGLYGAKAFTQHPVSRFPHAFLNLEGAGAGGRATLFRSTDAEVTKFYARSKHPFGSVVSGDGFKRGLVRSGTDYSVFTEDLGMRGLDVAFMEPRARYHTDQDDSRDTSIESLWHMLSASLTTVKGLSDDTSSTFQGSSDADIEDGKVNAGKGSIGVWFDLFGEAFAVFRLHTLFALSVTLLVAGPIFLILIEIGLRKMNKWYLFSRKQYLHSSDDDEPVRLYGWRGFFRFPLTFIVATAAVVALAYLQTKQNPYIIYSSAYSVWACMLSAWLCIAWFLLRLGDAVRPSALSRVYTLIWLYVLSWAALVVVTIGEHQLHLGSGYCIVIYNAAIFTALLISYLELFALPKRSTYAEHAFYGPEADVSPPRTASLSASFNQADEPPRGREGASTNATENEDANERTSLLNHRQTFTRYGRDRRRSEQTDLDTLLQQDSLLNKAYGNEQAWSSSLPRWTWFLQFLILAPINVILIGQIGLFTTSALQQTPSDGNPVLTIYLLIASISTLLLMPLAPFLHRVTFHIPTFIFFICVGTLFYNLFAFPFSRDSRLKVYFFSQIDLDSGKYDTALTGLQPYIRDISSHLPSAAGQDIHCGHSDWAVRPGLESCIWNGLPPHVVPPSYTSNSSPSPNRTYSRALGLSKRDQDAASTRYSDWLSFNITQPGKNQTSGEYVFDVQGLNTRACRLYLDTPISNLTIEGAGPSGQGFVPGDKVETEKSTTQIRLWSRTWDAVWRVHVSIPQYAASSTHAEADGGSITGKVLCIWADANQPGTIPALDELKHYMPVWSAITKGADGLVEGYKNFKL